MTTLRERLTAAKLGATLELSEAEAKLFAGLSDAQALDMMTLGDDYECDDTTINQKIPDHTKPVRFVAHTEGEGAVGPGCACPWEQWFVRQGPDTFVLWFEDLCRFEEEGLQEWREVVRDAHNP
jgi:hypothetical protein